MYRLEDMTPTEDPLLALSRYWQGLCRGRAMPARRDIDAVRIPELLPFVLLVDVLDGGADFRYRLMGEHVVRNNGRSLTGRLLSELLAENPAQQDILDLYREIVTGRLPVRRSLVGRTPAAEIRRIEVWGAPLSDDGVAVDTLVGAAHFLP